MARGAALTPDQARRLSAYNERVFERFVRKIRKLPSRTPYRHEETGHQTIFDTLVHILNVHEVWVGYILQGRNSDRELDTLFHDPTRHPKNWKGLRAYDRRVWALVRGYLARATSRTLAQRVRAPSWMPGRYIAADGLLQTMFEQAHHLGEIVGVLWQHDRAPPEMTWIRVGPWLAASGRRRTSTGSKVLRSARHS